MKLVVASVALFLASLPASAGAQFTDWLQVERVSGINPTDWDPTTKFNSCVTISKDGLSLIFASNRDRPFGDLRDLFVSTRDSVDDKWSEGRPLSMLNTTLWQSCPALSLDEHQLYFVRWQPAAEGGCGGVVGGDLVVSPRHRRRDDFGWERPVSLGCDPDGPNSANGPNMAGSDLMPAVFEDETGDVILYFVSSRTGAYHLYQSRMSQDGTFGPASPVTELNSSYVEQGATVRRDGLEVIFLSTRPVEGQQLPLANFWVSTRRTTAEPWSTPKLVPSLGLPALAQGKISLSFDGRELYFTSRRGGGYADLWVARREKARGAK